MAVPLWLALPHAPTLCSQPLLIISECFKLRPRSSPLRKRWMVSNMVFLRDTIRPHAIMQPRPQFSNRPFLQTAPRPLASPPVPITHGQHIAMCLAPRLRKPQIRRLALGIFGMQEFRPKRSEILAPNNSTATFIRCWWTRQHWPRLARAPIETGSSKAWWSAPVDHRRTNMGG